MAEEYKRHNENKLRISLVPIEQLENVMKVLEFGAKKYGDKNWTNATNPQSFLDSAQRHLFELLKGNELDDESGLPHASHVAVNMLMYDYIYNKVGDKDGIK